MGKVTPGIQSFSIERVIRLFRPERWVRVNVSTTSAKAAINSATPSTSVPLWFETEFSGNGPAGFAGATKLVGVEGMVFAGNTGAVSVTTAGVGLVANGN